jgi:hypothetical protein
VTCAAGPPAGKVHRFDDDVATAVSAIADIEKLLDDDSPLGSWQTTEYRRQCKAMKTRLHTMADRYAARAGHDAHT